MPVEVLAADAPLPASIALPRVVEVWRNPRDYTNEVRIADGGVWQVDDRHLLDRPRADLDAFAQAIHLGRARFVGRAAPELPLPTQGDANARL